MSSERRVKTRSFRNIAATVSVNGARFEDVVLTDWSAQGIGLQAQAEPGDRLTVMFELGRHRYLTVNGRVAWSEGGRAGLTLEQPFDGTLLKGASLAA